jgi:uncharacterized protein (DUF488 family)
MAKTRKLFTIGYEQTPSKAVLDELEQAGVKLLVDVRAVAAFRTCICAGSARRRTAARPRGAANSTCCTRSTQNI